MAERRTHLILVGLILAALVGAAMLMVPGSPIQREPRLGLDLQGGLEVILQAVPPPGRELTAEDLDRSVEIMRNRVDKLGVTEPEVTKQGEDQISIQLPGIKNPEDAANVIGKTAKLELYDFEVDLVPPSINQQQFPIATSSLYGLLAGVQAEAREGDPGAYYLFDDKKKLRAGPARTEAGLMHSKPVLANDGELPKGWKIFAVPENTRVLHCPAENNCIGAQTAAPVYFYLIRHFDDPARGVPEMTGADLKLDGTRQDFDTGTGQAIVTIQFTEEGEDKFAEITAEEARRGQRLTNLYGSSDNPVFQHFAIVLDGEIKSTPYIDFKQNPNGIAGGNGAQITGIGSVREAKDLALVLQTGALPVEFRTLEDVKVSATLGEDSLREALWALLGGLILVAFFLLVVYRFLGLVAVLGLAIYGLLLYAVILLFGVTLTLPGFAGMVLAIGVAADANIVIFERIKEESAAGRSVRAAISAGYSKGFATIIDANVVTAITALILFAMATGGVRGFAFLLLLGTSISIVTAVFATRALLALLGGFRWFDNPKFMGASAQQMARWQQFDAVGKRRIWFTIAGVAIGLSVLSFVFNGLNLGIDFRGGSQLSFSTPQPVQIADVRAEAARLGRADAQIQGRGEEAANGGFRQFQIKTEALQQRQLDRLTNAIERRFDATSRGSRNVSASFSEQILRSAIYAMVMSFILITIYITLRFQWRFAVPILRTIANDGLIALGIYSFSGREVTAATVAAFLTIIGYSIYDTIIIFDRVRENLPLMKRATVAEIVNTSLWETVRRSLATTFITLLPVGALFFFGGDTLKDFAFAILIGIGISAFSTIFIAAPFLAVLLERQPEYARRKRGLEQGAEGPEGPDEGGTPARPRRPVPTGPQPALAPAGPALSDDAAARRERRRQRRRTRPHGRAR